VRTSRDPARFASIVRSIVHDIDPRLALGSILTMEDRLAEQLSRPRLYSVLLAVFAGLALAIAGVGLFGMLAWSVAQRSRELAVRAAVGATPARLLTLVLGQGLAVTLAGVAVGLALAFASARAIRTLLYGVTAGDPLTYAGAAALVLAMGTVACMGPGIRAARLDAVRVLRGD
jgi:ABC-type antimicrobial peptide transport system permease subunit